MEFVDPVMTTALGLADWRWALEIAIGVLILVGVNFLFKRVVRRIRARAAFRPWSWKGKLDYIYTSLFRF